ncbi:MAG: sigma-70 family RNA polymerase sigma factor [Bdellovibrionales bacterium]|nr:sigma-70 family RNA polymerase sigma factor [Bdellovibrionales bacterium]
MKADLILIEEIKNGNTAVFAELVERHQKTIMKAALRITRDMVLAEDVVQESFIKAFQKLDSFEGRSSFKSWLYQITLNTARNKLRSTKKENVCIDHFILSVDDQIDAHLHRSSVFEMIKQEIDNLPEKQREAISLRVFDDMSFKEIAEVMNCPYDTAKANYRHALLKLKGKLEEHPEFKLMKEKGSYNINEQRGIFVEVES